jgi:uncharacterized protein (DUF2267 family)
MSLTGIPAFESTIHSTHAWLNGIMERLALKERQEAYHDLRAVLHVLRDRLSVDQAAALGSQLPMLIRGIFFEGWQPQGKPLKVRRKEEFLEPIAAAIPAEGPDAESVTRAVFDVLSEHVSEGEIRHIKLSLPETIRSLFAEEFHTLWF